MGIRFTNSKAKFQDGVDNDTEGLFVNYYNTKRLHSSIGYVAPVDKLLGKEEEIFKARDQKLHAARAERRRQREITPAVVEMKKHGAVTKYQTAT